MAIALTSMIKTNISQIIAQSTRHASWRSSKLMFAKLSVVGDYHSMPKSFVDELTNKQPLLINSQVKLVDPPDLQPTDFEWRVDGKAKKLSVSTRTERIIPIPLQMHETMDYKEKSIYKEGSKDTSAKNANKPNFALFATAAPTQIIKWEVDAEPLSAVMPAKITGAALPFSQLAWSQVIFYPFTLVVMHSLDLWTNVLPFWASIIATTACIRLSLLPFYAQQNKIAIKTANLTPQVQELQIRANEGLANGDQQETLIAQSKIRKLYDDHGLSMWQRIKPHLIQAPFFVAMFFHLRNLASVPLDSLITGGAFWFSNLTLPDPTHALPIITTLTVWTTLELGMRTNNLMGPRGRWLMRLVPLGFYWFIYNFPAAILLFWTTSNAFTLFYSVIMRTRPVKQFFNIPDLIKHNPKDLPLNQITFRQQVSTLMDKASTARSSTDLRRLDDIEFRKAGTGPLRKTYKQDEFKPKAA